MLDKYKFDAMYHLAAQSAGEPAYDDPKYDILTNSYGTCLLARYCLDTVWIFWNKCQTLFGYVLDTC